ncbi:hypothetical protein ABID49_002607 [Bhargavaea ullalensis]|uniref:NERD domain-containing protein n=1 Tax=Bhargavaea ullalensis TaxID=1265685 RepID=A0ABV2GEH0_9BACL
MKVFRKYPLYLHALKRLEAYLPDGHWKLEEIQEEIYRQEAGYSGEKAVDKEIRRTRLEGPAQVLTDLQFQDGPDREHLIQIDTLILTAKGIWILEAKRYRGKLRYQTAPRRLERHDEDGSVLTFDCPILQLENQIRAVKNWLKERDIHLPVSGKVAFVSRNTWEGLPSDAPIIPAKEIPAYLEGEYQKWGEVISPGTFGRIAVEMALERSRFNPFPLCTWFKIDPNDLKRGILCPACKVSTNRKSQRRFHCPGCQVILQPDYGAKILDWFLLVYPTITNYQFRIFAGIQRQQTASRLLSEFELVKIGNSVNTCFTVNLFEDLDSKQRLKKRRKAQEDLQA